jgi:hypothetical protein
MPAPNDLVTVSITAADGGTQSLVFKPSLFVSCLAGTVFSASDQLRVLIYFSANVYTGSNVLNTHPVGTTGLTVSEANTGVAAVYAAVNAYYTAVNS